MKLLSLKLCNFRQFYGKTPEIILSSGLKNATIIHGNNGAGKTTILNAFTWVLYEKFTAAFASPELLINKRAITEVSLGTSVECYAEIIFEHESKRYQVKRRCFVYRDNNGQIQYGQNQFFMLIAADDGCWYHPMQQPEEIINRILPESLHQYFFFDGEHIDHIFRSHEKNTIAEDTKELLGVKILDRAIEHLKKAKKTLQDELNVLGDSDIKTLIKQKNNLEQEKLKTTQRKENLNQQLTQYEELKKNISEQLLKLSGAEELKQLKEKLEKQEKNLRNNLVNTKQKIKKVLSSKGYITLLTDVNSYFYGLIEELRNRGELPSGIKQKFIEQLLDRQQCICGSQLNQGTEQYLQVQSWQNKAGMADVEEAAIRLESNVIELERQMQDFWHDIDSEQANIQQWRLELSQVETELDDIRNKFRHYPDEDLKNLQKRLDEIEISIRDVILEQGVIKQQQEILLKDLETLEKQISRQKIKEEKQILAQKRLTSTQDAIERLIEVRKRVENQFRLSLEKRVQEIFNTISFTPYIPRINSDYEIRLVENTSGVAVPVAASTGENQILSLSFIGGIIDRVRDWSQKNTFIGLDSSTFPMVMDSPFGSLDEIYRRQVAKAIPQIANQLIVLVTKTQWRGEVETEMRNYIGKEYVLVYHSPKPDCEEDSINIDGKNYPLVVRSSNGYEYTEIIEVEKEIEF
ncbi:ATP-binding protein [Aphanothece hegewaldii CCALA 016]|uniref:Nuclease SbcCD subunit C n=1 Tax=Aphanothece hegewaldii CCALA 016 TaxID=2107694 RepID=A0A2T1LWJ9_9CHRO|nr:AAA family ATPase [Aphanothece hegewaldii]PSF36188.1 ATP-binding protein [Aphanothece hegewaldii CCALA 016]